jgi:predicted site-specific integrase-resolvase
MKKLKPKDYIDEYYPFSKLSKKTIINWIKNGKIKGEQTPTGRWLVLIDDENKNVKRLLAMMESAGI